MEKRSKLRVISILFLIITIYFLQTSPLRAQPPPDQPKPRPGAYFTGVYPNLFRDDGHSAADIKQKVDTAYRQLFHGDPDTQRIYFEAGRNQQGNLAYILDVADKDVRTEGMSYGMMIAVQTGHRAEFDALWNWARTYMYNADPMQPSFGYYSWSCKPDGTKNTNTSAPDGEEYFATALYFASGRWGDGGGLYDYHARADELLHTMLHRKRMTGQTPFGNRDVDAEFDPETHMVRFLPEPGGRDFTDPSYHLPGFYELWARWGPVEDRPFWAEAARTSRRFFLATANAKTGLAPVYANFDGTPHPTSFAESAEFGHDAWRVASNWSWDWTWFQSDPTERALSDRLQTFFASQGKSYGQIFTLEGTVRNATTGTGLVATNAVASLAATPGPQSRRFVEALWDEPVPAGRFRYYDGMLYLLSLLHVSGEYKVWTPAWAEPPTRRAH
jgi:oligosaccharide reducing-end xylanase